ncbi:MAG: hypothetical protein IKZ64_01480 [Alphaproteobacteria bacterium]|nr:hypothetical protein [Alphaproteobacteria bacterium]
MRLFLKKLLGHKKFVFTEEYVRKILGLQRHMGKIETLVLGSSHIEVGFVPKGDKEYNCGTSSQDLYSGYRLYQYANSKKLKNIIISFSAFSPFNDFMGSPTPYLAAYLKIMCGIEYADCTKKTLKKIKADYKKITRKIKRYTKRIESQCDLDKYNGKFMFWPETLYKQDEQLMSKYAVNDVHRFFTLKHNPIVYLSELIREARDNNQKVYIVVTPIIDKLYKELMVPEDMLFREIYALAKIYPNVKILNYYNDKRFVESDFYDWQHLNKKGADKLTKLIRGNM